MTSAFNWRAIFWFLTIVSGLSLISFIFFFRDTFRRERSLNYQNVIRQRRKAAALLNDKQPVNLDLSFADLNPMKPLGQVLRRINNILVLIASGNFLPCFFRRECTDNYVRRMPVFIYVHNLICICSDAWDSLRL